jgi:hypothetical protein
VERRARDIELLEALDAHAEVSFEGDVWRIVREERDARRIGVQSTLGAARIAPRRFAGPFRQVEALPPSAIGETAKLNEQEAKSWLYRVAGSPA